MDLPGRARRGVCGGRSARAARSRAPWAQVSDRLPKGEIYPGSRREGNSCGLAPACAAKKGFLKFFMFLFSLCLRSLFREGLFTFPSTFPTAELPCGLSLGSDQGGNDNKTTACNKNT